MNCSSSSQGPWQAVCISRCQTVHPHFSGPVLWWVDGGWNSYMSALVMITELLCTSAVTALKDGVLSTISSFCKETNI